MTVDVSERQNLALRNKQTFEITTVLPDWFRIETELSQNESIHLTTIQSILITTNLIKFKFLNL